MSSHLSVLRRGLLENYPSTREIVFDIDPSINQRLADEAAIRSKRGSEFNPYLIEQLLSEASSILDRCLAYRREAQGLATENIKQGLDVALFEDLKASGLSLEIEEGIKRLREVELDGHRQAAKQFDGAKAADALAAGFEAVSSGNISSSIASLNWFDERKKLIEDKWNVLSAHNKRLRALMSAPDGSLHLKQRFDRVVAFLITDFGNAFAKAMACEVGLKVVYGLAIPLPKIAPEEDVSILDELVAWTRACVFSLEARKQGDIEFDIAVPLASKNAYGESLCDSAKFKDSMRTGGGTVVADLTRYFDNVPIKGLRCRAAGLSYVLQHDPEYKDELYGNLQYMRGSGVVFAPADHLNNARQPLVVPSIGFTDKATPLISGVGINNADPCGAWTVQVNITVWYPSPKVGNTQNRDWLNDVVLHLRLAGTPVANSDWTRIPW